MDSWQVAGRKPWYSEIPDTVFVSRGSGDCTMLPGPKLWDRIWESSAREARPKILVYIYIYIICMYKNRY